MTVELKPWRYEICYGPDGEANYAFVYDGSGSFVSNLKLHHAIAVVERMNLADDARIATLEAALRQARAAIVLYADPRQVELIDAALFGTTPQVDVAEECAFYCLDTRGETHVAALYSPGWKPRARPFPTQERT